MTKVLYLVHDLDDPATGRRVGMLEAGGAQVQLAGFRRATTPLDRTATVLGQTHNGRFVQRGLSALRVLGRAGGIVQGKAPDVILARSLEMLPLARRLQSLAAPGCTPRLVYEVLDVHRLMLGTGMRAASLRMIEGRLCRTVAQVLVSSTRFDEAYFRRYGQIKAPLALIENKVWNPAAPKDSPDGTSPSRSGTGTGTITIGWFGILRCAASLRCLDAVCRHGQGRIKLVLRGRPARDSIPDFHQTVRDNPHITFHGAYSYPDDLARIYGEIDIAWLIDRMDAGGNSDWLLPNRLYESGAHGIVPLALDGTETGSYLKKRDLGLLVPQLDPQSLGHLLDGVDDTALAALRARIVAQDPHNWRMTQDDCAALVDLLAGRQAAPIMAPDPVRQASLRARAPLGRILIVIPTLNEAKHITAVIQSLRASAQRLGAMIVVVDGGSTDGTTALVRAEAARCPGIILLHNPQRLQSAAINLAVDWFRDRVDWIIRADAHAAYPPDYCDTLLDEARRTGADSVVVRMHATGSGVLQRNIAAAQNALFGNGGSPHRSGSAGRFVAHGHHALMRVAAFTEVGGYDETFSHNEDAELDHRLTGAGHRIWLTGATRIDYFPRDSLRDLATQYVRFGQGRAATAAKHPGTIHTRHLVLIALAPLAGLSALGVVWPLLAVPLALWLAACLLAGVLTAMRRRQVSVALSGLPAAVMQMAWSFGFWRGSLGNGAAWLAGRFKRRRTLPAMTGEER